MAPNKKSFWLGRLGYESAKFGRFLSYFDLLREFIYYIKSSTRTISVDNVGNYGRIGSMIKNTTQTATAPAFFSVAQAAMIMNVSEKTIRRFLDRGLLRSSKATRTKLIPAQDIETFFERTK